MQETYKHFFISYNKADRQWAEWIAWQLEEAGYTTLLQVWDFRPGSNFVLQMDEATRTTECTLLVLSSDYLKANFTQPEWAEAFRRDPKGEKGHVIPVRVRECEPTGLLASIVYIDLVGLNEAKACERLLAGIRRDRAVPTIAPAFPGTVQHLLPQQPRFPSAPSPLWNIPYRRNPYFTDQESILTHLHDVLNADNAAALIQPQAISGLGGIGKTQIALEYAYRHRDKYQAVLWVQADSQESLTTGFIALATLLNLPEKDTQDQTIIVESVRRWLDTHNQWLLILDNADDLTLVDHFLPASGTGHTLLTTRAQTHGTLAQGIEVEEMDLTEGAIFLLRRAQVLALDAPLDHALEADRSTAQALVQELGGLPLALDQAGAYIHETMCGVPGYLTRYQTQHATLLRRRGKLTKDHPKPVATTWSLSFERVKQANPAAANLLGFCSFLYPDAIPEELITEGASHLSSTLQAAASDLIALDEAVETLRAYSFIRRNPDTSTLSMHRLVQVVLKDAMTENEQRQWAEQAVRVMNQVFPLPEVNNWPLCERYLLNAQTCASLIEQWGMTFPEATHLLNQTGAYLQEHTRYSEAERLLQRTFTIYEQVLGTNHPDTASSLNNLALLYEKQGTYPKAEPLLQHALAIREQVLGDNHPDTANSLNSLALLYYRQGKYPQAEPLYQRALTIREQVLGANHPYTPTGCATR
jgi:tetratricopeptide (TPR) repeat protein